LQLPPKPIVPTIAILVIVEITTAEIKARLPCKIHALQRLPWLMVGAIMNPRFEIVEDHLPCRILDLQLPQPWQKEKMPNERNDAKIARVDTTMTVVLVVLDAGMTEDLLFPRILVLPRRQKKTLIT